MCFVLFCCGLVQINFTFRVTPLTLNLLQTHFSDTGTIKLQPQGHWNNPEKYGQMIPTNSLNPDDKTKRQQSKTNPNEYLTGYTVKLGYIWAGVILCMKPMNANEDVKLSLIGWSHTQNDSCYQRDSIIHPQNQTMATIKRSIITRKVLLQKLTFYSNYLGLTSSLTHYGLVMPYGVIEWLTMVQVMPCHLFHTKLLPEPTLTHYQLPPQGN